MAASTSLIKALTSVGRGWSRSALAQVFRSGRWLREQGSIKRRSFGPSSGPTALALIISMSTPKESARVQAGSGSANQTHVAISRRLLMSSVLLVPDISSGGPGIHSASPWKALWILPPLLAREAA